MIAAFIVSAHAMSQSIEWPNPDQILILHYPSDTTQSYSKILYVESDSIKEINVLDVYVGEETETMSLVHLDSFLVDIPKHLARCNPCILRDGDRFVEVFNSETKWAENAQTFRVTIHFENATNIAEWELKRSISFRYFYFEYSDYELRN